MLKETDLVSLIQVPVRRDDEFNMDVALLDIEVLGMTAKLIYIEDIYEYHIRTNDKNITYLTLKGYSIKSKSCIR